MYNLDMESIFNWKKGSKEDQQPESKFSEAEGMRIRETAGQINIRIAALMYLRVTSDDPDFKANATLALETLGESLKWMLKHLMFCSFDTSHYNVGDVVRYNPDVHNVHFGTLEPGVEAVIVNPPMDENSMGPQVFTHKPTVPGFDELKRTSEKFDLVATTGRGVYLFD